MKKYLLFLAIFLTFNRGGAQTVYLNSVEWPGYIYACYSTPVNLTATVSGSNPPDSCIWLSENFDTLSYSFSYSAVPGTYTFGLIDNGIMYNYDLMVFEDEPIVLNRTLSSYGSGTNVSTYGGNDGYILLDVQGGQLPYTYAWSNSVTTRNDSNLTAGSYSITVTDAFGCSSTASNTLTQPPQPLTVSGISATTYGGGYNISVNGKADGKFKVNIAGGSPPYKLNINGLTLGNDTVKLLSSRQYSVEVRDENDAVVNTSITLSEPTKLQTTLVAQTYTVSGETYNLSCHDCGNGSVTATVSGGVSPYTYSWNTGQTTASISNLSGGYYILSVTDNNGAILKEQIFLTAPDKDDWSKTGNSGTNSNQFLGTTDNSDFVFKTNNTERMRFTGSGGIVLPGLGQGNSGSTDSKLLIVGPDGNITGFVAFSVLEFAALRAACGNLNPHIAPWLISSSSPLKLTNCVHNFGFGVADPLEKIHVAGQSRFGAPVTSQATDYLNIGWDNGLHINAFGSDLLINDNSSQGVRINVGTSQGEFETGGNSYLSTLSGNVGIGTSTPHEKLSIGDEFVISDRPTKIIARNYYYDNTSSSDKRILNGSSSAIKFSENGDISLATSATGSANSDIIWNTGLSIDNSGKVGIHGLPNSLYDVNIAGNTYVSNLIVSNFKVSNDLTIEGSCLILGTNDFKPLYNKQLNRALAHGGYDELFINYDGEFEGGTIIGSRLSVAGNVTIGESASDHDKMQILDNNQYPVRRGISVNNETGAASVDLNFYIHEYNNSAFNFRKLNDEDGTGNFTNLLQIRKNGKVGIGLTNTSLYGQDGTDYKLYVAGGIKTEKIRVELASAGWSDYVFEDDYKLISLNELKEFINANGHLPGIPSACEVEKDGIDIAEMQSKMLAKIEELTLYVIELKEENNKLKEHFKK